MGYKLTVRFGGAADSEVHDYSDLVRLWNRDGSPATTGGMMCNNGNTGGGEFVLDDLESLVPGPTFGGSDLHLAAHNEVTWSHDGPGYDAWLSKGRISVKNVGRPYTYTAGKQRQFKVQYDDCNIDLDGITLLAPEVRPAEFDTDRVLWLLATFCNGSPRLTTVIENHLVDTTVPGNMPAKTYPAGTELIEIFNDCANTAGKVFSVVIHNQDSASHKCLLYIDESNHTLFASTLSISDQHDGSGVFEADGETVFVPVWRQGTATVEDGQELHTGELSVWGADADAYVSVVDDDHRDAYDYWVKPFFDDVAESEAEATTRATFRLHTNWIERYTHQPSILIPARLHDQITAGMSINIRSVAALPARYLETEQWRRIAEIEWEPAGTGSTSGGDAEELLWANLSLDRPVRVQSNSRGRAQPAATSPKPAQECAGSVEFVNDWTGTTSVVNGITVPDDPTQILLLFYVSGTSGDLNSVSYDPDNSTVLAPLPQAMTKLTEMTIAGTQTMQVWYLLAPTASVGANGAVSYTVNGTATACHAVLLKNVDPTPLRAHETTTATSGSASISNPVASVASDFVVSFLGFIGADGTLTDPVPGGSQTLIYAMPAWRGPGDPGGGMGLSYQVSASQTDSWTASGNNFGLGQLDLMFAGCTSDIPPASDDDTGAVGTATCYARCDHKHPVQTAAVTPITDTAGDFTATNVEDALAELQSDAETDAAALTAHTGDTSDAHDASAVSVLDTAGNFTATDVEAALAELAAGGGGSALTVEEVDGSPTDSAVTKIVFPNGTLVISSHEATYTPLGPMINTDADAGTKIYVGLTDPDGVYTLAEGDVWIDRNP